MLSIRDDDINQFSDLDRCIKYYRRLNEKFNVTEIIFGVIPKPCGCIRNYIQNSEKGLPKDLDKKFCCKTPLQNFEYLSQIKSELPNAMFCVHGFSHCYFRGSEMKPEFGTRITKSEFQDFREIYNKHDFLGFIPPSNFINAKNYRQLKRIVPKIYSSAPIAEGFGKYKFIAHRLIGGTKAMHGESKDGSGFTFHKSFTDLDIFRIDSWCDSYHHRNLYVATHYHALISNRLYANAFEKLIERFHP